MFSLERYGKETMKNKKSHGERVKECIVKKALELWTDDPKNMTLRKVAQALNMTHPNVIYHFGSFDELYNVVAAKAVQNGNSKIINRLILDEHKSVAHFTPEDKQKHFSSC